MTTQRNDGGAGQPTDDEIDLHLQLAMPRGGGGPDLRQRDKSIGFLAAHADAATPAVLAELKRREGLGANPGAVIRIMSALHTPEVRRELERLLAAGPAKARLSAGAALAQHPNDDIVAVLVGALAASDPNTIRGGLEGLRIRADEARCVEIDPLLGHADSEVRWTALNSAIALGCVDDARLAEIATTDRDQYVRELAAKSRAPK